MIHRITHAFYSFVETLKNLAMIIDLKIILLYQNNYIGHSN